MEIFGFGNLWNPKCLWYVLAVMEELIKLVATICKYVSLDVNKRHEVNEYCDIQWDAPLNHCHSFRRRSNWSPLLVPNQSIQISTSVRDVFIGNWAVGNNNVWESSKVALCICLVSTARDFSFLSVPLRETLSDSVSTNSI